MKNTTCDKGDIAVAKTIADLTAKGIKIAVPLSAHLPFDLIAFDENYKSSRIQVKYCSNNKRLILSTQTVSVSSKVKVKPINFNHIDAYAVYSSVTDKVYYVNIEELKLKKRSLKLRIDETCKEDVRIKYASNYLDVKNLWLNG
jgi:hypothetical protein